MGRVELKVTLARLLKIALKNNYRNMITLLLVLDHASQRRYFSDFAETGNIQPESFQI